MAVPKRRHALSSIRSKTKREPSASRGGGKYTVDRCFIEGKDVLSGADGPLGRSQPSYDFPKARFAFTMPRDFA